MVFKEKLYNYDVAVLKDYGGIKQKITVHRVLRNKGLEVPSVEKLRKNDNSEKLLESISRAKSKIFEYAYCNKFEIFVTLTIDSKKYDRTDLKTYYKDFSQWLRDYQKKYNIKIQYLFIPELHKDGQSWHLHGLMKGLPKDHLTINNNGYYDWEPYKAKFGYISLDFIRDTQRTASYITKYISKNLSDCIKEYNAKMYYCSKGLKTATEIKRGTMLADIVPDFENDFVKVQWFENQDIEKLKNLIR